MNDRKNHDGIGPDATCVRRGTFAACLALAEQTLTLPIDPARRAWLLDARTRLARVRDASQAAREDAARRFTDAINMAQSVGARRDPEAGAEVFYP